MKLVAVHAIALPEGRLQRDVAAERVEQLPMLFAVRGPYQPLHGARTKRERSIAAKPDSTTNAAISNDGTLPLSVRAVNGSWELLSELLYKLLNYQYGGRPWVVKLPDGVGIDATTLEAGAALRSMVRRDAGESYETSCTSWPRRPTSRRRPAPSWRASTASA